MKYIKMAVVLAISCAVGAAAFLYAKNNLVASETKQKPLPVLKIVHDHWPGWANVVLADKLGYCKDEGIRCEITMTDNYNEIVGGLLEGRYDIGAGLSNTLFNVLHDTPGSDLRIVLATDFSKGADGIIARKDAPPLDTAPNPLFVSDYLYSFMISRVLNRSGHDIASARFVGGVFDESTALQMLRDGTADYHATYEPYLSLAVQEGMRLEYSSKDDPGLFASALVANATTVNEKSETLHAFVHAYFRALKALQDNPTELQAIAARAYGVPVDEFAKSLKLLHFYTREENVQIMDIGTGLTSLPNIFRLAAFTRGVRGLPLRNDIDINRVIDKQWVVETNDKIKK